MYKSKKAISPVIATVLLIAIVVVIALIIFLWARGFIKESILKKGENVELVCSKVNIEASYISDSGELQITNIGNIPVYRFNLKTQSGGSINNAEHNEGIANGQSLIVNIDSGLDEVKIIPVILGQAKKSGSKVAHVCTNEFIPEKI